MKDGLLAARHKLIQLKAQGLTIEDAIESINQMLEAYYKTVQIQQVGDTWIAYRGNFVNNSQSPYGVGASSSEAVQNLYFREQNN